MATNRAAWQEYDRWNAVVADVLFPELDRPAPVYLDVEDHEIEEIGARVGVNADVVVERLGEVVGSTIDRNSVTGGFKDHIERVRHWQNGPQEAVYPAVAALATFSLAAEQMASGDGLSSSNYYGRLANLLGGSKGRLHQSYMKVAEPLWAGLNLWLDRLDGRRGTPTAYALGKRFVGLPMSQALVREADRRRLEQFFVDFDLAPRSDIPAAEIEPLLTSWFRREHQTSHLGKLWAKASLRERFAEVAAVELRSWDGIDTSDESDGGQSRAGRALLALRMRNFPKQHVQLFPFFLVKEPSTARSAKLAVDSGDVAVDLVPAVEVDRAMVLGDGGAVDPASLLGGVLTVRDSAGGEISRMPRGVVVFRDDDQSSLRIETTQVLMGDDIVILALDRSTDRLRQMLADVARPGWTEDVSRSGLPEGWTLFENVEILARPANESGVHNDLRALIPLTSSQLKLTGGLSLPGASRNRWHSARPPHVRAISDSGSEFTVRLLDLGGDLSADDVVVDEWTDDGSGSVLVDSAELQLDDGHYAVEMVVGSAVTARREFSLHSSETRDEVQWSRIDPIVHDLGDPLAVLGAGRPGEGASLVQGVLVETAEIEGPVPAATPPSAVWWKPRNDQARPKGFNLRAPEVGTCFYTGAHRFDLPDARRDNDPRRYVSACTQCGMKKTFSGSYYRNATQYARRHEATEPTPRIDVRSLPPIPAGDADQGISWDVALDALRYLGGGPMSALERVVRQIEPSSLFLTEFVATLEALGHLEVRRSADRLVPEAWEIAPTAIVDTRADRVLAGYWPPDLVADLEEHCEQQRRTVSTARPGGLLTRTSTDASADELADWCQEDVLLARSAGYDLAAQLPVLSAVITALPRVPVTSHGEVQVFDPPSARWVSAFGVDTVGAYRAGRFASTYYIRTENDVAAGTIAVATAYLAKHWAAVTLTGKPLIAYSEKHSALVVPLGALLPGMYQRAVVLDSGIAPEVVRRQNHAYRDVSAAVAGRITYLLEN
ncbi:hypothetical protein [Promicromonospora sp. NPDC023987]|uniref:hypothetical protein n=1 Tax=Promicromonospora sp. NPDC023987 TaxID=3155360 RepID=UPI0033CB7A81